MLKLIRADLYKSFHRPYLFVFIGILSILAVLYSLMFPKNASIAGAFSYSLLFLGCLPFFPVMIVDIVMSEEMKYSTMKNTVSSGTGRDAVFIGKSITSILLTAVCAAVTALFFFGTAYLWLSTGRGYSSAFMSDYLLRIAIGLLLVVGAIFVAMFLAVVFEKNSVYAFTFAGLMLIPTLLFKGLSFKTPIFNYFYNATILGQAEGLRSILRANFYRPILVAILHVVIFGIAGILVFRRREVK